MKRNKGITLIALVITIIVLLILAGVAISMLSGENGILRKAAEAKTKTEEAQKEENTTLVDMELDSHFITNNLKYKCRYGYITGIGIAEKAENLKKVLDNQGYVLRNIENTADVANETNLTTGMAITKNGKIVARAVIFGDIDCSGDVNMDDLTIANDFLNDGNEVEDYQLVAMDVNHDGKIDQNDIDILISYDVDGDETKLSNQNYYATKIK